MNDLKTILQDKKIPTVNVSGFGIGTSWQEKALRYASELEIVLTTQYKSRWFKMFKQASMGRKAANIEKAYSYLKDYPGVLETEHKIKFFFFIYERGLVGYGNNT